jgi:transcriptional regulator with GAF, ATPase, and Fis domain
MPEALALKVHQSWDDGVSSLVMLSAESLNIHGEGLQQFKLARFAKAALIVPIKARQQPIGVITVAREKGRAFSEPNQRMLEAVADYASISLVNSRLFQALSGRAKQLEAVVTQTRSGMQDQRTWMEKMRRGLQGLRGQLPRLVEGSESPAQRKGLQVLSSDVDVILQELEQMLDGQAGSPPATAGP